MFSHDVASMATGRQTGLWFDLSRKVNIFDCFGHAVSYFQNPSAALHRHRHRQPRPGVRDRCDQQVCSGALLPLNHFHFVLGVILANLSANFCSKMIVENDCGGLLSGRRGYHECERGCCVRVLFGSCYRALSCQIPS